MDEVDFWTQVCCDYCNEICNTVIECVNCHRHINTWCDIFDDDGFTEPEIEICKNCKTKYLMTRGLNCKVELIKD